MVSLETTEGRAELFGRVHGLSYFTPEERAVLAGLATVRRVEPGGVVYAELTRADSFAVIASGTTQKRSPTNRRDIEPNTLIGKLPLLHRSEHLRRRTVGLVARTEVVLVEIPYRALDQVSAAHRDAFIEAIAEEAVTLIERIDH